MTALIGGLQTSLIDSTLGSQPHLVVEPIAEETRPVYQPSSSEALFSRVEPRTERERPLNRWLQLADRLAAEPGVEAVAPVASGPGFAVRGTARKPVQMLGIEPEQYLPIIDLQERLTAGDYELSNFGVILGATLADELGAEVGDRLRLVNAGGEGQTFTVRGIVEVGAQVANESWAIISLRDAQSLQDLRGGVTRLEMTVAQIFEAESIAARLQETYPVQATSWQQANRDLLRGLCSQSSSSMMITVFVVIAVALGIASVLIVSVVQRRGQIGVLRAMGASMGSVVRVFLIQGAMVGLIGSVAGSFLGWLLMLFFVTFARDAEGDSIFPIEFTPELILGAAILATITGLLAAVLRARLGMK